MKIAVRLDKKILMFCLLMFSHIKPKGIPYISGFFDNVYDMGRLATVVIIALMFFAKKKSPSRISVYTAFLGLWIVFTTYVNSGNLREAIIWAASISAVALIINYFQDDPYTVVRGLYLNLEWIVYVNLYSVVRYYPYGQYKLYGELAFYFLGNRNMFIQYILPAIAVGLLSLRTGNSKIRVVGMITAGVYSIYRVWSATSLVMLITFGTIFAVGIIKRKNLPMKVVIPGYLLADFGITKFDVMEKSRFLRWIVEDILHKRADMTGRRGIWEISVDVIKTHPIMGVGYYGVLAAHNQIYELLTMGGIVSLAIYSMIIVTVIRRLIYLPRGYTYAICVAALTSLFIGSITEGRLDATTFLLISLCYSTAESTWAFNKRLCEGNFMENSES